MTKEDKLTAAIKPETADLLKFAFKLADLSGTEILPHFRNLHGVEDKSGSGYFDPVTAADRSAEQVIRNEIAAHWPDHDVIGEEFGGETTDAEYCWLIDPIDGTRPFVLGLPVWGTLIGLLRNGVPVLGLMNQPFTKERFWASQEGAFSNGPMGEQRIATRSCDSLDQAVVSSTHPDMFACDRDREKFEILSAKARMRWFGGDCYGYCLLASGQIDLIAESGLSAYDIVPLVPIVEAAGGRITTWQGGPVTDGGSVLASGDPKLHDEALNILTG